MGRAVASYGPTDLLELMPEIGIKYGADLAQSRHTFAFLVHSQPKDAPNFLK